MSGKWIYVEKNELTGKYEVKPNAVPSSADLEDNKTATIDVSTYTEPVEITPTAGKDGMKKATVTLNNIPSGGNPLTQNITVFADSFGSYLLFLNSNLQPITNKSDLTIENVALVVMYKAGEDGERKNFVRYEFEDVPSYFLINNNLDEIIFDTENDKLVLNCNNEQTGYDVPNWSGYTNTNIPILDVISKTNYVY